MTEYTTTAVFTEKLPQLTVEHEGGQGIIKCYYYPVGSYRQESEYLYDQGETLAVEVKQESQVYLEFEPDQGWIASQDNVEFTIYNDRSYSCVFSETQPDQVNLTVNWIPGSGGKNIAIEANYEVVEILRDPGDSFSGSFEQGITIDIDYAHDDGYQVEGDPPTDFELTSDRTIDVTFVEGENPDLRHIFLAYNSGQCGRIRVFVDGNLEHTLRSAGETYAADLPYGAVINLNYYASGDCSLVGDPPSNFQLTEDRSIAIDFEQT